MITRVEIDGFKSFDRLALDLRPFTVVAGPNASGKSNFFDALRFVSKLATDDLSNAAGAVRGDPVELFRRLGDGQVSSRMRFAVELLLDPRVEDAFGQVVNLKYTRVRYDVALVRRPDPLTQQQRLYVEEEYAAPIRRSEDRWLAQDPRPSASFISAFARYSRGAHRTPFIETKENSIVAAQDGRQGRPRPFALERATATVLSSARNALDFPHIFAIQRELGDLTYLQLEASAERRPSDIFAAEELLPDGSNLAKVLARIEAETRTEDRPQGILAAIRSQLASLIPGVSGLRVERDDAAGRFRFYVTMKDQSEFSSNVLSEGTLRILALLTVLNDPRRRGVLLFEEPENGIHEQRLRQLIEILRGSCADAARGESWTHLFQIILNTHSPIVLAATDPSELVAADVVMVLDPAAGTVTRRTRMRSGVVDELALDDPEREHRLTRFEADHILRHGSDLAA